MIRLILLGLMAFPVYAQTTAYVPFGQVAQPRIVSVLASTSQTTLDTSLGGEFHVYLQSNTQINFTVQDQGTVNNFNVRVIQDSTGNRSVTWNGALWPSGVRPSLSLVSNSVDLLTCTTSGTVPTCALAVSNAR